MPNWTTCILNVNASSTSEKEAIKTFVATKNEDEDMVFDFNKIIPMPESLNIEAGGIEKDAIVYFLTDRLTKKPDDVSNEILASRGKRCFREDDINSEKSVYEMLLKLREESKCDFAAKADKLYDMGKQYIDNVKNYGHRTWYSWCKEKWGTKCNASNARLEEEYEDFLQYQFDTAWSEPAPVIAALSKLFPDASFELGYSYANEPEMTHYDEYVNGKIKDSYSESDDYEEYV